MRWAALVLVVLSIDGGAARADDSVIGYVKTVAGTAALARGEQRVEATPGMALYVSDVFETGEDGALGMTFKDNTILTIGPDTRLALETYAFMPTEKKLGFVVALGAGTLQYISGAIARLAPDAVMVKTPAANITVRGTRFLVRAEAGAGAE